MPRSTHVEAILGHNLYSKICDTRTLIVGAGGIGCELLKNVVMTGFGHITLLDLDTIDLSNLNRQFLFRKNDVKQSKAMVAAKTASQFNPAVKIHPIHANIKEVEYDVDWFSQFDIVLNALDNLDARRHVNKMCLAANVPLVESGTAGYLGQVQPILKDHTECFDCLPKATPKTFPVCTIRSTPSQPIHCIVWAKSYLLPKLFGEDDEDDSDLEAALAAGENPTEIASLRSQAHAFRSIRGNLSSSTMLPEDVARAVFEKVFNEDIKTLLGMVDMWKHRNPPTALDCEKIEKEERERAETSTKAQVNGVNGVDGDKLKDQKELSLADCLELFIGSAARLSLRLRRGGETTISFDKDDVDTLDFVTASSNLRSYAYGIAHKTKWEIKEMAGNIIPAIATTNAIIAGIIVLQALHLLRRSEKQSFVTNPNVSPLKTATALNSPLKHLRNVAIQSRPTVPLSASRPVRPNASCSVCRDTYMSVRCDPARTTLSEVVSGVLGTGDGDGDGTGDRDISLFEGNRLLADPDFDDNMEKPLSEVGVGHGQFLTIVDEDGEWGNLSVAISRLPPNHPTDGPHLVLPSPLPIPRKVVKPTLKRPRTPSPDLVPLASPMKRQKLNGAAPMKSPTKKQRLEEDGLVIMENDLHVINID